ncbi:hypothetical protein ACFVFJ_44020 [Streptomyces sp. NPDC057717]|uniref:hypothetical protein n=1 Tax=Streptomyces sp. NPDC057717 TaxID=3346224 RepID=UPI00369EBF77
MIADQAADPKGLRLGTLELPEEVARAPSVPDRTGNCGESRFRAGTAQRDGP